MLSFIARIIILVIGLFQVHIALIIYLALPILAFLQNMVDQKEERFVDTLDKREQADYFADRNQIWGNTMKRYSHLLRDSFNEPKEKESQQWQDLMKEWLKKVDQEITMRQTALENASPSEKVHLHQEIKRLEMQQSRLKERERHLKKHPFVHGSMTEQTPNKTNASKK